ncbi:hypothetical protein BJV77DRAFT_992552 [Russula vinacea]|nr:hypothetical protein BJV77DRAFT_992552 [Russula vinacea]
MIAETDKEKEELLFPHAITVPMIPHNPRPRKPFSERSPSAQYRHAHGTPKLSFHTVLQCNALQAYVSRDVKLSRVQGPRGPVTRKHSKTDEARNEKTDTNGEYTRLVGYSTSSLQRFYGGDLQEPGAAKATLRQKWPQKTSSDSNIIATLNRPAVVASMWTE